jgi:O-succinylbenzoic acid--CoA ligase
MKLSIAAAAAEVPGDLALIAGDRPFTFAELAADVERAAPPAALRHRAGISARCLSPAIDLPSTRAILAALERRAPLILRHPGRPAPAPAPPILEATDALAIETSGSTATPRLVRLGRAALIAHSEASAARLGWRADDRWLIALPLAHVGGLAPLLRCLIGRKAAVLVPRFIVAAFADAARRHRATLTSLVPAMLAALLDDGWRPPETLRAVLVGGAAATPSLLARARDRGVPVVTAYGMTETFSHVALDGALLPGVEAREGEAGVLWVRGPMLFSGYAGEQARAPGDWHPTGDLGEIDGEGRLQIRGRADEVIVTGGENVSPAAVERAIAELFPGAEVCVFGLPDARWGEIVCAAVAAAPSLQVDALARALAGRVARFEIPRQIFVLPDLPRLPSGKIDRRAVIAWAARRA